MLDPLSALSSMMPAQTGATDAVHFTPTSGVLPGSGAPMSIGDFNNIMGGNSVNQLQQAGVLQTDPTAQAAAAAQASLSTPLAGGADMSSWGRMVQKMVMDVNAKQQDATAKVNDVLAGGPTPVHEAVIASEEAGLSFEFLAEMRNKVVDAYQQVMQMQV